LLEYIADGNVAVRRNVSDQLRRQIRRYHHINAENVDAVFPKALDVVSRCDNG